MTDEVDDTPEELAQVATDLDEVASCVGADTALEGEAAATDMPDDDGVDSHANYDGESVVNLGDTQRDFRNAVDPFVVCQHDMTAFVCDDARVAEVWGKVPKSEGGAAGVDDVHHAFAAELPVLSNHPSAFVTATGDPMALITEGDVRWVVFKAYYCAAIETTNSADGTTLLIDLKRFQDLVDSFGCDADATTLTEAFDAMESNNAGKVDPADVATWIATAKFPAALADLAVPQPR
jgi:hypothetical protein